MPGTSDVIYLYDGSFEGLLCCVHESVYTHELPVDIQPEEAAQPTLFRQKYIAADEEKAARVLRFHSPEDLARRGRSGAVRIFELYAGQGAGDSPLPSAGLSARTADDVSVVPHCWFSRCWPRGRIC